MEQINEIIKNYITGEKTLEEVNEALAALPGGLYIDPQRNIIRPGEENKYGLLDTGTGSLDKVSIRNGKLVYSVGNMPARVYFKGKCYEVKGDTLILD